MLCTEELCATGHPHRKILRTISHPKCFHGITLLKEPLLRLYLLFPETVILLCISILSSRMSSPGKWLCFKHESLIASLASIPSFLHSSPKFHWKTLYPYSQFEWNRSHSTCKSRRRLTIGQSLSGHPILLLVYVPLTKLKQMRL